MSDAEKRYHIIREDLKKMIKNFCGVSEELGKDPAEEVSEVIIEAIE